MQARIRIDAPAGPARATRSSADALPPWRRLVALY
jgi:hypothetical protein